MPEKTQGGSEDIYRKLHDEVFAKEQQLRNIRSAVLSLFSSVTDKDLLEKNQPRFEELSREIDKYESTIRDFHNLIEDLRKLEEKTSDKNKIISTINENQKQINKYFAWTSSGIIVLGIISLALFWSYPPKSWTGKVEEEKHRGDSLQEDGVLKQKLIGNYSFERQKEYEDSIKREKKYLLFEENLTEQVVKFEYLKSRLKNLPPPLQETNKLDDFIKINQTMIDTLKHLK
jgi:hypothetical protein